MIARIYTQNLKFTIFEQIQMTLAIVKMLMILMKMPWIMYQTVHQLWELQVSHRHLVANWATAKETFVCLFCCVCLFGVYCPTWEFFPHMETSPLLVRTANFDICSALMAIEQWGFFNVPQLLSYGLTFYNGHLLRTRHTLVAEHLAVELSQTVLTTLVCSNWGLNPKLLHVWWTL